MTTEQPQVAKSQGEAKSSVPEIHAAEKHRKYKLIDLDNSVLERTAIELVEGGKMCLNRDLWVANFQATVKRVREWCDERPALIQMVLVDVRSNKVLFYFVPTSDRYDLSLGDQMTALEVELGGGAGIGYVETLQVPSRSLDRFIGRAARTLWKNPSSTGE